MIGRINIIFILIAITLICIVETQSSYSSDFPDVVVYENEKNENVIFNHSKHIMYNKEKIKSENGNGCKNMFCHDRGQPIKKLKVTPILAHGKFCSSCHNAFGGPKSCNNYHSE